jgi:hypothetical protein
MKSHFSPMGPVQKVQYQPPTLKGGVGWDLGPILWMGPNAVSSRLACRRHLGHYREGSGLQVCQAVLTRQGMVS